MYGWVLGGAGCEGLGSGGKVERERERCSW